MNEDIKIRGYLKSDYRHCIEIFNSNCPTYFDPSEKDFFESWLSAQGRGENAYRNSIGDFYYVVLNRFDIIGCGGFYLKGDQSTARITWLMIHNDFLGMGFGTMLTMNAIQHIEKMFPDREIVLDTSQHCVSFFEKIGFSTIQVTENAYGPKLDKYEMSRMGELQPEN